MQKQFSLFCLFYPNKQYACDFTEFAADINPPILHRLPSALYFHSPQVLNGVVYHLIYLVTRPIIIHYGHPVCHLRMIKHKTLLRPSG